LGFLDQLKAAGIDMSPRPRQKGIVHKDELNGCTDFNGIYSKTEPWGHQREAIEYLMPREAAMLAMGMGTGKSKVIIDLMTNIQAKRVLIACPKSVTTVWPKQVKTHACGDEDIKVVILQKGSVVKKTENLKKIMRATRPDQPLMVVMNYESMWREPMGNFILSQYWDIVALDESHRIKSAGSKVSLFCSRLRKSAGRRLCLTGTPMPHSQLDVYGQFRFLDPTVFGTNATIFRSKYAVMGGPEGKWIVGQRNEKDLQDRFHQLAYVVDRSVLDLPDEVEIIRNFELPAKAKKIYQSLEKEFYAEVDNGEVTVTNGLVKVLRLHQVTSGFVRNDDEVITQVHDEKAALFEDVLTDIDPKDPVVVFVQFRHDFEQIRKRVEKLGRKYFEVSGKANTLSQWEKEGGVLAVQFRAGSEGLDLTNAAYCVYYSLTTLGPYQQSKARTARPGQKNSEVRFIYLLAGSEEKMDTIDQKMYKALQDKADVVRSIIEKRY
jgi:SNF2 family DNA or RNA helicase